MIIFGVYRASRSSIAMRPLWLIPPSASTILGDDAVTAAPSCREPVSEFAPLAGPANWESEAGLEVIAKVRLAQCLQPDPALPISPHPLPTKKAGRVESTTTGCRNGFRLGGSTTGGDPKSTPASNNSTLNTNSDDNDDNPSMPPDTPSTSTYAEPIIELRCKLRDIWQRYAIHGSDRNRPAEAARPKGAARLA